MNAPELCSLVQISPEHTLTLGEFFSIHPDPVSDVNPFHLFPHLGQDYAHNQGEIKCKYLPVGSMVDLSKDRIHDFDFFGSFVFKYVVLNERNFHNDQMHRLKCDCQLEVVGSKEV